MAKNKKGNKKSKQAQQQQQQEENAPLPTTPPTSSEEKSVQVHVGLTHTNTDKTCLDTNKPRPFRWFYQYNLWTGLYMLNPSEQNGLHLLGMVLAICTILYLFVFINGFRDGFNSQLVDLE